MTICVNVLQQFQKNSSRRPLIVAGHWRRLLMLLREAARCAAIRYWRQVGAVSVEAAVAIYSARYRRHWGAELALPGALLRFSWAYLAFQAPTCQAGMTFGTSSIGFDPADSAQYAAEAAPILGSPPSGQDRY